MASGVGGWFKLGAGLLLLASVVAGCQGAKTKPVSFYSATAVTGDPSGLKVAAEACQGQPYEVRTSESAKEVRVELIATAPSGESSAACADVVKVRLKQPLAARRLIDVTSGHEVPVGLPRSSP
jgi:hypothetical protein